MKPIVTWILIANARTARILAHHGPGKGLAAVEDGGISAAPPLEYSDAPGSRAGPAGAGASGLEKHKPAEEAEASFAALLASRLATAAGAGRFDRLILAAAPHMLGTLRGALDASVKDRVMAELPKDLTQIPEIDLPDHLGSVIAV